MSDMNPTPLTDAEEEILNLLLELSPPDPEELTDPAPNVPQSFKDFVDRHLASERAAALTPDPEIDVIIKLLEDLEACVGGKPAA